MFDRSAYLYDLLYEQGLHKDYAAEADLVASLLPGARKVCRMSVSDVDDGCSVIQFHYLVATNDGVEHFTDAAGLHTTVDPEGGPMGRGLVTGRS